MSKWLVVLWCCVGLCAWGDADLDRIVASLADRGDGAFMSKSSSGFRIYGIGTATIDDMQSPDALQRAEQIAKMQAQQAVSSFVKQTLKGEAQLKRSFEEAETGEEGEKKTMSLHAFRQEIAMGTASIMRGVATVKVIQLQRGTGLACRVLVAYTSQGMLEAATPEDLSQSSPAPQARQDEWLSCRGRGASRVLAVKAAILEGVQQVYGTYIEGDMTYRTRFSKLMAGTVVSEENLQDKSLSQEMYQGVLTQTKGFVEAYRIMSVVEVKGSMEATVRVKCVQPRDGGVKAVMVYPMEMPLHKRTKAYQVGPQCRMSGAELGDWCQREFEQAFVASNKYLVLNGQDIAMVMGQQEMIRQMSDAQLVTSAELTKVGRLLTADVILLTRFNDLSYSCKRVFAPSTGKLELRERMIFSLEYSLIEVKSGETLQQNKMKIIVPEETFRAVRDANGDIGEEEYSQRLFEGMMRVTVLRFAEEVGL